MEVNWISGAWWISGWVGSRGRERENLGREISKGVLVTGKSQDRVVGRWICEFLNHDTTTIRTRSGNKYKGSYFSNDSSSENSSCVMRKKDACTKKLSHQCNCSEDGHNEGLCHWTRLDKSFGSCSREALFAEGFMKRVYITHSFAAKRFVHIWILSRTRICKDGVSCHCSR